jgi:hypothetical protein
VTRAVWVVALGGLGAVASAAPPPTKSAMLPTRRSDAAALTARVETLARKLDERRGVPPAGSDASSAVDLGPTLDRANAMLAAGKVDDAAVLLDLTLDLGVRSPGRLSNPSGFLHAHVARAVVALARREVGQAEALLARALRYDPTLTLSSDESSPRVRVAFDEVRRSLGAHPALDRQSLGDLAQGRVLVGRAAADGQLECLLFDNGRLVASTLAADDAQALAALDTGDASTSLVVAPLAPVEKPALVVTPTEKPRRRRTWLWALVPVGAAVVAGVVVAVVLTRPSPSGSPAEWNVEPHF